MENHIVAHPAVENVCVVAMPDERLGERACAFVIPRPGQAISFEALKEFLLARDIASFKLPERLELIDAFPLSPSGTILRRELRVMIAARLAAEQAAAPSLTAVSPHRQSNEEQGDVA
ncbi:MAG: hypothetical protein IT508_02960 [Burkholderiaceae bacterium]|nr:hypothetical protein [Burkholderiaceae bacterium]